MRDFERAYWTELHVRHAGNIPAMALEAGVHRTRVYHRLKLLNLNLLTPSNYGRRVLKPETSHPTI